MRRAHVRIRPIRWYLYAMRTTIDRAGRIVIPRAIRETLGLQGGEAVEIVERDGRIEIDLPSADVRLEKRGRGLVAVADAQLPPLRQELIRETLERTRR
jgi:AbrB family looped-hinge helix DNA binding protein